MLLVTALLVATSPGILKSRFDRFGTLTVAKAQWEYIHQELASMDSTRVLKLISPRLNLKVRIVNTSFPEPSGKIRVDHVVWNHANITEQLRKVRGFDVLHPTYAYQMAVNLVPGQTTPYSAVKWKGGILYEDNLLKPPKQTASERRFAGELNRLSPITFVRLRSIGGRLWLSEIGSGTPAE